MRRLGKELDRDPMSLYRHAIDRAALLDGVAEFVLDQLVIPTDGGWRAQLRRTANDFRDLCLDHPNVVPLLVTRPPATPLGLRPIGTLRPLEQVLAVLIDAGFPPVTALRLYRAYFALLYGYVLNELQETVNDPEESKDLLRLGLRRLPATDFVHIRGLETELGRLRRRRRTRHRPRHPAHRHRPRAEQPAQLNPAATAVPCYRPMVTCLAGVAADPPTDRGRASTRGCGDRADRPPDAQ